MNTVVSIDESSSAGFRIPTTVNHVLPRYTIRWPPTWLICEDARGLGAEHDLRVAVGDGVEEVPRRHRGADDLRQVVAGRVDADPAGLLRGHERGAEHGGARDLVDGGVVVDVLHVVDHRHRRVRQDLVVALEVLTGRDRQQVRPELVDRREQVRLARGRDADDGDHRADPDRDPERRQRRSQPPGAQALERDAEQLARRQPRGVEAIRVPAAQAAAVLIRRSSPTISPSRIWIRRRERRGDVRDRG